MGHRTKGQSDVWRVGRTRVAGGVRPIAQTIRRRETRPLGTVFSDCPDGRACPSEKSGKGGFCVTNREEGRSSSLARAIYCREIITTSNHARNH